MAKTDSEIKQQVLHELKADSRVDETEVGVEVHEGIVTLTGTVQSWAKRIAAAQERQARRGASDRMVCRLGGEGWPEDRFRPVADRRGTADRTIRAGAARHLPERIAGFDARQVNFGCGPLTKKGLANACGHSVSVSAASALTRSTILRRTFGSLIFTNERLSCRPSDEDRKSTT